MIDLKLDDFETRHKLPAAWSKMFYIGLLLYGISFFLVAQVSHTSEQGIPMLGWECAAEVFLTLRAFGSLSFLGMINPMVMLFVVLRTLRKAETFQVVLRWIIFGFIFAAWVLIRNTGILTPHVGFYCWAAGMLLIVFAPRSHRRLLSQKGE